MTDALFTMPSHTSELIGRLAARLAAEPAAPALDGERLISLSELFIEAEALAAVIRQHPARVIAWTLEDSWRWVVTDLACMMADRIAVPIPDFFSAAQITAVLSLLGHGLWIGYESDALPVVTGNMTRAFPTPLTGISGYEWGNPGSGPEIPDTTSKITFTSGSTGEPKGVCLDEQLLVRVAQSINRRLGHELNRQTQLSIAPLAVLLENIAGLYRTLLAGGCYVLPASADRAVSGSSCFRINQLSHALCKYAPGLMIASPRMLPALTEMAGDPSLECLRYVAVGGAPVTTESLTAARLAGIPVYQGYGLSECGSVVCLNTPGDDDPASVGRPLPHVELSTRGEGELFVRGPRHLGYLGGNPITDEWIATGDRAEIDPNGRLHFKGRIGQRIITDMGRNVAPEWVEAAIEQAEPALTACVIEDHGRIAALIDGAGLSDDQLTRAITVANDQLPDYARVHRWARLPEPLTTDNGCLTGTGRPRRAEIAKRHGRLLDVSTRESLCIPS